MDKVRWGLLSTANINRKIIPAIRASHRGELAAVSSRDPVKAKAYAMKWEIPMAFESYEAMLASDAIDCVYIGLPNHLHAEWSIKAMQAGKHVLCEKPIALSVEEVDRMIEASHNNRRVLAEAFMYRHHPQMKMAGEWVQSGKIGEPVHFYSVFTFRLNKDSDVRLVPGYGGGCLWDVGVYPVSLSQYLFAAVPEWVLGAQVTGESGVDLSFNGLLSYPGGRSAQIFSSFQTPYFTYAELIGTEGSLTITKPFIGQDGSESMIFTPHNGEPVRLPIVYQKLYSGEVEDMHDAILNGTPTYISLEESRDHIRTVTALYRSVEDNKKIMLK